MIFHEKTTKNSKNLSIRCIDISISVKSMTALLYPLLSRLRGLNPRLGHTLFCMFPIYFKVHKNEICFNFCFKNPYRIIRNNLPQISYIAAFIDTKMLFRNIKKLGITQFQTANVENSRIQRKLEQNYLFTQFSIICLSFICWIHVSSFGFELRLTTRIKNLVCNATFTCLQEAYISISSIG